MAVVVEPKQYLRYSEGLLSSTPVVAGKLPPGKLRAPIDATFPDISIYKSKGRANVVVELSDESISPADTQSDTTP